MLQELDDERERRWKAEQATRRLINTVKDMQEKGTSLFTREKADYSDLRLFHVLLCFCPNNYLCLLFPTGPFGFLQTLTFIMQKKRLGT